jgi:hypothetical protein
MTLTVSEERANVGVTTEQGSRTYVRYKVPNPESGLGVTDGAGEIVCERFIKQN